MAVILPTISAKVEELSLTERVRSWLGMAPTFDPTYEAEQQRLGELEERARVHRERRSRAIEKPFMQQVSEANPDGPTLVGQAHSALQEQVAILGEQERQRLAQSNLPPALPPGRLHLAPPQTNNQIFMPGVGYVPIAPPQSTSPSRSPRTRETARTVEGELTRAELSQPTMDPRKEAARYDTRSEAIQIQRDAKPLPGPIYAAPLYKVRSTLAHWGIIITNGETVRRESVPTKFTKPDPTELIGSKTKVVPIAETRQEKPAKPKVLPIERVKETIPYEQVQPIIERERNAPARAVPPPKNETATLYFAAQAAKSFFGDVARGLAKGTSSLVRQYHKAEERSTKILTAARSGIAAAVSEYHTQRSAAAAQKQFLRANPQYKEAIHRYSAQPKGVHVHDRTPVVDVSEPISRATIANEQMQYSGALAHMLRKKELTAVFSHYNADQALAHAAERTMDTAYAPARQQRQSELETVFAQYNPERALTQKAHEDARQAFADTFSLRSVAASREEGERLDAAVNRWHSRAKEKGVTLTKIFAQYGVEKQQFNDALAYNRETRQRAATELYQELSTIANSPLSETSKYQAIAHLTNVSVSTARRDVRSALSQ